MKRRGISFVVIAFVILVLSIMLFTLLPLPQQAGLQSEGLPLVQQVANDISNNAAAGFLNMTLGSVLAGTFRGTDCNGVGQQLFNEIPGALKQVYFVSGFAVNLTLVRTPTVSCSISSTNLSNGLSVANLTSYDASFSWMQGKAKLGEMFQSHVTYETYAAAKSCANVQYPVGAKSLQGVFWDESMHWPDTGVQSRVFLINESSSSWKLSPAQVMVTYDPSKAQYSFTIGVPSDYVVAMTSAGSAWRTLHAILTITESRGLTEWAVLSWGSWNQCAG